MTSFSDLTTMGVGGHIDQFIEPTTPEVIIEQVEHADANNIPVCVIGGGSNLLASDEDFHGIVLRDARRGITAPEEPLPLNDDRAVKITAEAGCNWDDFVDFCVNRGLEGVEGLSGIPGNVGASVVQNIGAYGQEVASVVASVQVWDREDKQTKTFTNEDMQFGYRSSLLKASMYKAPGVPNDQYYPSPRYIVLSVTFTLNHTQDGTVNYPQLAAALHVNLGDRLPIDQIRAAVLEVRASKGMLEDATRYRLPIMQHAKLDNQIERAIAAQQQFVNKHDQAADLVDEHLMAVDGDNVDINRHSCGSFFMNPIVSQSIADQLPQDAPRYPATLPDGSTGVKVSAAWLIEHAGFHKGYRLSDDARASLSDLHTLSIINRGGASSADIVALASAVRDGVAKQYHIDLIAEPVLIGLTIQ